MTEVHVGSVDREAWRKALLNQDATLQDSIACLDRAGLRMVLVVDSREHLVGTITDGDIRRGLLRGMELTSGIGDIMHRTPLVVPPSMGTSTVLQLMLANKLQQIPIVGEQGMIVGLHLWDGLSEVKTRSNKIVVMAGGKGTRLLPLTENCPKPMLEVAGKPILEHIILRARAEGFSDFTLAIGHLGEVIKGYFGDGGAWGIDISYLVEETPLGTAGALASLHASAQDAPIMVTNGDVLTDVRFADILDFHERHAAIATMAVRGHEWQNPFGVIEVCGADIVAFREKPVVRSYINGGIYALSPVALGQLENGSHCDMPELFERLKLSGHRTVAYPMHEPWLDVGRPDDFSEAQDIMSQK